LIEFFTDRNELKNLVFILAFLAFSEILLAADFDFVNRDFSISNGKISYRGSQDKLGKTTINDSSETYKSKTEDVTSLDFFHVHLKKANGKLARAFEFTEGTSGLKSGTIKFNDQGQPLAYTGCEIWSGCVTITKQFCNSILRVNGKDSEKVKECTYVLDEVLTSDSFKSPYYQNLAASEFKEIEDYRETNNMLGKNENSWGTQVSRFFATDKGRFIVNDLKQNQSKNLGDYKWDYRNAIRSLGRIYQLCEDHSMSLVLGPEERDPNRTTKTFQIKIPVQRQKAEK